MKTLQIITIVLLFFNFLTGISGGLRLIIDPSGKMIQLSSSLLTNSPFQNYLIPGIALFVFVGLISLFTAILATKRTKYYQYLIILEGIALLIWISVEMIITHTFHPVLHLTYIIISTILIIFGLMFQKKRLTVQ